MKKFLVLILFTATLSFGAKSQELQAFDSVQFTNRLQFAAMLVDYEYIMQVSLDKLKQEQDSQASDWFCYAERNTWHTVTGSCTNHEFTVSRHVTVDTLNNVADYKGNSDVAVLSALGCALAEADSYFQLIRDTTSIYFNSFAWHNPDKTVSIWFLPAFQPSGQAIYGCEWEYIFDETGTALLKTNSFIGKTTGVWIGQPREIWLNYRGTDAPTVGSMFFALSFRDYFTRLRIDTRTSTSTTMKGTDGLYTWSHKMK
jgi:hypothetical protein